MKKNTSLRNAFITSILSIVLSCAMLVGTSFAWLTDHVTSEYNKIVAGLLYVEFEYLSDFNLTGDGDAVNADLTAGKWKPVDSTTPIFKSLDGKTEWEPGHVELAFVKVKNMGNLALEFNVKLDAVNKGDGTSIANHILVNTIWDVGSGMLKMDQLRLNEESEGSTLSNLNALTLYNRDVDGSNKNVLLPTSNETYFAIALYMPEDGDFAPEGDQTLDSVELKVTFTAEQTSHETDVFGSDYDKGRSSAVALNASKLKELNKQLSILNSVVFGNIKEHKNLTWSEGTLLDTDGHVRGFVSAEDNTMYILVENERYLAKLDAEVIDVLKSVKGNASIDFAYADASSAVFSNMFTGKNDLTSVNISNLDLSGLNDKNSLKEMFSESLSLTSVTLTNVDFGSASLNSMFAQSKTGENRLTDIAFNDCNTSKVVDMTSMFENCTSLTSLDLSCFDTSKVQSMQNMFNSCSSLKRIYVNADKFVVNAGNTADMFSGCEALQGGFNGGNGVTWSDSRTSGKFAGVDKNGLLSDVNNKAAIESFDANADD